MRRIPYVAKDLCEPAELVESIKQRRGGALLELDRMLLHSPAYADGWNTFLGNVRNRLSLPQQLAELAICYVAVLNKADYEWQQHSPLFLALGGQQQQLVALTANNITSEIFSPLEQAVLQLCNEMTRHITVSDETMKSVKECLKNDQQVVEIVGVIAAYNMVSRFLVALEVESE